MDKYEFNIKVEQLKRLVKSSDYRAAMTIADTIDWRRVSSVSLLSMVSEIYEKNRDYNEAKEILKLAYDRAPLGKRLLYKLSLLSLQEGDIQQAEAYYREFYDIAPEDPRQHILRYLILKEKGAPEEQLINTLEQYNREELDEHWMYELAELYFKAGRNEDCVAECDRILLMFGIGGYVDKAIDLKVNKVGVPLTEYQQDLLSHRDKYNNPSAEDYENRETYDPDADAYQVEKPEETVEVEIEPEREVHQKEVEKMEPEKEAESVKVAAAAIPAAIEEQLRDHPIEEKKDQEVKPEDKQEESGNDNTEEEEMTVYTVNFIVERRSDEDGLAAAVRLLKLMHEHTGSENKVTKIKASKLNTAGVMASREKLIKKDIVVEQAGDLDYNTIEEIIELIKEEPEDRVVVLIDNPMQVRKLLSAYPELTDIFHVDKEDKEEKKTVKSEIKKEEPVTEKPERVSVEDSLKTTTEIAMEKKMSEEEMDIDDFANYAQEYAESIDCSISGKSKLALYERIEIMEEDGIPLTRENAVALIEEAADAAENPSLGHKLSSMFQSKYDKEDRLILREEHFIK